MLEKAGFKALSERDNWKLEPNGKYYFTRNQSTLIAFAVGGKWKPGNGFVIAAAHTDSPVLKVKPISRVCKHGYLQVGVEPYGGGLWTTWFDRDLSVAGRVIVSNDDDDHDGRGTFTSRLVCIRKPILRIPMLAIHLQRDISDKGFNPNKQTHVLPLLATSIKNTLDKTIPAPPSDSKKENSENVRTTNMIDEHHSLLLNLIAAELAVSVNNIRDFELSLFDTQPSVLGGAYSEFVFSPRLDNLCMSYISLRALIDSVTDSSSSSLSNECMIRMTALFDNEEIGSESQAGAASNLMNSLLTRINGNNDNNNITAAIRKSMLISADMAHAVHPNYSDVHEENHRPHIHKGLVIKHNGNQRYATNSLTAFPVFEIARRHNIPLQKFCVRNDVACGSTIGPILSANTGIRTVDVGVPQLSMHSIREMAGTADIQSSHALLIAIFREFAETDTKIHVDHEQ